ncbi:MAG: SDR family NAD(P)-dependent oxidoreductase, partial [Trueperaceae bacterium]
MRDISGTTAFVTGGSKGIGRAVAVALCRAGVHVTITGRDEAALEASAEAIRGAAEGGAEVLPVVADVRDPRALERAAAATVARFGGIDLVVANAGVGHFGSIVDMSADDWHSVIDTNLSGVFHTVKATLDALIERRGMLITIGSLAGVNTFAGG